MTPRRRAHRPADARETGEGQAPGGGEGPVEPRHQRRDVGGLDRGAAPDAQARRRVAVAADVVGDALGLEQLGHPLDEIPLRRLVERRRSPGRRSAGRPRCSSAPPDRRRGSRPRACGRPSACSAAKLASARARVAASPPIASIQSSASMRVGDAEHRRRVDRLAGEDALDQLAALGHAEDLRQRPVGRVALQPLDGARREHQHAVRRLAAHRLLPGEGGDVELVPGQVLRERRRGRVAERQPVAVRRRSSRRPAPGRPRWCRSR